MNYRDPDNAKSPTNPNTALVEYNNIITFTRNVHARQSSCYKVQWNQRPCCGLWIYGKSQDTRVAIKMRCILNQSK